MSDAEKLSARQQGLAEWKNESVQSLIDWAQAVRVDEQGMLENPLGAMGPVEELLRDEDISTLGREDFNWLAAKLLVYVAAVLAQANGGSWAVDDDPSSPSYTRYVIRNDAGEKFDPGRVVMGYFGDPPGRSLVQHIAAAEAAATT
ncbi:hypothetical protein DVA67_031840 [Solirubrobacter sp. CPCC 204708]|uniref:Uncharacterized protein n=1 Tax=Solirubrobacter deserti TaxID=2282478 RepID=A0ABT4RQT8_9ACTN|nr:hypothetical protein [Solirubrobacter deserti]MBE2320595.1 hypothetical protein [Solirubrobacter deserti]MDA0140650.1 hypothetical protein [Solirubrobacter deserti]